MSASLPPPPPSDVPVPRRPDLPTARRFRTAWVVPLIAFIAIAVLVGAWVAVASLDDVEVAGATPSATTPGSTGSSPQAPSQGDYRISERTSTGVPVRWTQCTITYRLMSDGAPSHGDVDVEEAFARLADATGFTFERVDDHTGPVYSTILEIDRARTVDGADVVIAWLPHDEYVSARRRLGVRHSIAWATNFWQGFGATTHYDGAYVVIDLRWSRRSGFDGWWSHGMTVLHELGHVMGLDHVKDRAQVMYDGRQPTLGLSDLGGGDLEGLEIVGAPASCAA